MAEAGLLLSRAYDDSKINPDKYGAPLVIGEILFKAYATSANPTAEALNSTVDAVAGHVVSSQALNTTLSLSAGTIAVPRDGIYEVSLSLGKVSAASASGVMDFSLQKNAAALTNTAALGLLQPAVAANSMSGHVIQRLSAAKGDLFRIVVTGTVGGVITITYGSFSVRMLGDLVTNPTQA